MNILARLSRAFVEASTAKLPHPRAAVASVPPVTALTEAPVTLTQTELSGLHVLARVRPSFTIAIIGSALPVPFAMFLAKSATPPHAFREAVVMGGVLVVLLLVINVVSRWWLGPVLSVSPDLFVVHEHWPGKRQAVPLRLVSLSALQGSGVAVRMFGGPVRLPLPGQRDLLVWPGLYSRPELVAFIEAARSAQAAAT